MEYCTDCQREVTYNLLVCPSCGASLGAPNVRMVTQPQHKEALDKRYEHTCNEAKLRGCETALDDFVRCCDDTFAVINCNVSFLDSFLSNDENLYAPIKAQLDGGVRIPPSPENESDRAMTEASLLPRVGGEMVYAALSLDGRGLASYGSVTLRLRTEMIRKRSTVLQTNSYHFVRDENKRLYFHQDLPKGYMVVWDERQKLCAIKCGEEINNGQSRDEYGKILLTSTGDRWTDEYLEVIIFRSFDNRVIERVYGKTATQKKQDKTRLKLLKNRLHNKNIPWEEMQ